MATLSFLKLVRNWPKNAVINLAFCCGAIWRRREKPQYRCTTTIYPVYNCSKRFLKIYFLYDFDFGAHKLVHSEPFLEYRYEIWHLLSALCSDVRKKYIGAHPVSAINNCSRIFSNPSAIYTKWCAQTFPQIFWDFRNFWPQFREHCGAT